MSSVENIIMFIDVFWGKYIMNQELELFFKPKTIAVVGASANPTKIGHAAFKNILISDYQCKLYPVNLNEDEILGLKCYKKLTDIPGTLDLVLISVPAPIVSTIIKDCVKKKVKYIIIITSGFSEIGNHEGEEEIKSLVKGTGIRILGPNTMGYKNASDSLDASFVFGTPRKGNDLANNEFVGLSKIIGVGNKIDIDDDDLINYLSKDPETKVIGLYIEQIKEGRAFMNSIKACNKPVLIVKAGKSVSGARATASHTGSMAGSDSIYSAAIKQAGGIRCRDVVELFDMARALAFQPPASGNRIGIITNGGGVGILLSGLVIPKLSENTYKKIEKILPPLVKPNNPVDLVGDAGFYRYWSATQALLQDPNIDGIIVASIHAGYGAILKMVNQQKLHHEYKKPILGMWVGGKEFEDLVLDLKAVGVPIYPSSWRTARVMWALWQEGERIKQEAQK